MINGAREFLYVIQRENMASQFATHVFLYQAVSLILFQHLIKILFQSSLEANNNVPLLKLFDRLPCESSLLPLSLRRVVGDRSTIEAVDICRV